MTLSSSTPSADPAMATLLIECAEDKLEPRTIGSDTTIGRDRRCAVMIDHPTVSRQHARIYHDTRGWHFVDLGSQNGSRLGETRASAVSALRDGVELRIGRVRAWFFSGTVPADWSPPDVPQLAGKLIRCTCGHIGWAPIKAGDGLLKCTACGREIVRRDPTSPRTPNVATTAVDCAACHTMIAPGEAMHTCSECAATMHAGCWDENRGCATYGCSQVGVLDAASAEPPSASEPAPSEAAPQPPALSDSFKQSMMAVAAFAGAGLLTFGVPPIGYGAWLLVTDDVHGEGKRRFIWAATSFAAGVVGFACSGRWWLGVHW